MQEVYLQTCRPLECRADRCADQAVRAAPYTRSAMSRAADGTAQLGPADRAKVAEMRSKPLREVVQGVRDAVESALCSLERRLDHEDLDPREEFVEAEQGEAALHDIIEECELLDPFGTVAALWSVLDVMMSCTQNRQVRRYVLLSSVHAQAGSEYKQYQVAASALTSVALSSCSPALLHPGGSATQITSSAAYMHHFAVLAAQRVPSMQSAKFRWRNHIDWSYARVL